jgi:hypothetical protein
LPELMLDCKRELPALAITLRRRLNGAEVERVVAAHEVAD